MSKKDKIKLQIDYLKVLIVLFFTALFAIVGWIVTIRTKAQSLDLALVGIGIAALGVIILILNIMIYKKFDEIEKED